MNLKQLLERRPFTRDQRTALLSLHETHELEMVQQAAREVLLRECGPVVYYRGLVEFSNVCDNDCFYCGIRHSNNSVRRYDLTLEQIIEAAKWCAEQGYGSVVLQSGEQHNEAFIEFVVEAVWRIKQDTVSAQLPQGAGITLCVGEQSRETYRRFRAAGAHRYLLRIETTNPTLYAKMHPPRQKFTDRIACLNVLREEGFQVGTGVMIGIPGQTVEDLADDIGFFVRQDIDMIGMGPFIPHEATPLGRLACVSVEERMRLSLLMIAVTRLSLPDVNIAATTALQALDPMGREKGIAHGANIIMPQLTPTEVRSDYLLYPGKPCLDESAVQCRSCLELRVASTGMRIGYNEWGDSLHARKRLQ